MVEGSKLSLFSLLSFWPLNIIHPSFYEAIHIQILLEVEGPFISSVYSAHREPVLWLILFLCFLCFNNDLPSSIQLWKGGGDGEIWVGIMWSCTADREMLVKVKCNEYMTETDIKGCLKYKIWCICTLTRHGNALEKNQKSPKKQILFQEESKII